MLGPPPIPARSRVLLLAVPLLALPCLLWSMTACADFETVNDPTGGLPDVAVADPSFEHDVQPIFTKRCSIGGCHSLATAQAGLVLTPGVAYDALVDQPATLRPGAVRVSPFQSGESWLIHMVGPDASGRVGLPRMPLASTPLTPNQIATLVNWIDQGARRE
jgi:hypothetical protein